MINKDQEAEVLARMKTGRLFEGLGLGEKNGRLDMGGLSLPAPSVVKQVNIEGREFSQLAGRVTLEGVKWVSMDFTGASLNDLSFQDCEIRDCVFDKGKCRDWAVRGTTISDTSFKSADLRGAGLGLTQPHWATPETAQRFIDSTGKATRNTFSNVNFDGADLRDTIFWSAELVKCTFKNTRLKKVDFSGTCFTDCIFEGTLDEVCFNRMAYKGEAFPPNTMLRVDFSRAYLRNVEFRCLDLNNVIFPENMDHIVIEDYPETLDRLIQALRGREDIQARAAAGYFGVNRKWVGTRQRKGILNIKDLLPHCREELVQEILQIIRSVEGPGCSATPLP